MFDVINAWIVAYELSSIIQFNMHNLSCKVNKTVIFGQLIDKLPLEKAMHGGSKHDASKP